MIKEIDKETGYLNQIKLYSVNHPEDTKIAVTSQGEIVGYSDTQQPLSAKIEKIEITNAIIKANDIRYTIPGNANLYVDFGELKIGEPPILLMQEVGRKRSLDIQIKDSEGNWKTIDTLWTRTSSSTSASKILGWAPDENGHYILRIVSSYDYTLDSLSLITSSKKSFTINECKMIDVQSQKLDNPLDLISSADDIRLKILPDETVTFTFETPINAKQGITDFVIYSQGYYLPPS
jgi:hypothetical protein